MGIKDRRICVIYTWYFNHQIIQAVTLERTWVRRPETGDRRPKTEDGRPETGDRRRKTGDRRQKIIALRNKCCSFFGWGKVKCVE